MPLLELSADEPLDGPALTELAPDEQLDAAPVPGQMQALSNAEDPVSRVAPGLRKVEQQARAPDRPFKNYKGESVPEGQSGMFDAGDPETQRLAAEIGAALVPIPGLGEAGRIAIGARLARLFTRGVESGVLSAGAGAAVSGGGIEDSQAAVLAGAAGAGAGAAVAKGAEKVLAPFASTVEKGVGKAQELLDKAGAVLTPGKATDSTTLQLLENAADVSIFGIGRLRGVQQKAEDTAAMFVKDFATAFQSRASKEEVGAFMQEALESGADAFRAAGRAQYKAIDQAFGNTLVDISGVQKAAVEIAAKAEKGLGSPEIKRITDSILSKEPSVDWETAQILRSDLLGIGRNASELVAGKSKGAAKELAGSMDAAMETAAKGLSADAASAWRGANDFWKSGAETFNSQVIKSLARRDPEAVFDAAIRNGRPGTIRKVREIVEPEDWTAVQGQYLDDLIRRSSDATGERIDGSKLLANMKSMGDGMKELFPDAAARESLNELANTLRLSQKRLDNGQMRMTLTLGQGAAIIGLLSGNLEEASAATLIAPAALARVLTNRMAVKWLTTGISVPAGSKAGIEAATKLGAFLAKEGLTDGAE